MKTRLLFSLFLVCTLIVLPCVARAGGPSVVDVRFAKTAFGSSPSDEAKYRNDFRERLVPALSRELSKEFPGYRLTVTFERIPSNRPSIHYVSHRDERIAYEEPNVLRFNYQLLDSNRRVVGTGRTELAESVSFAEPGTSPLHREFTPETQLLVNWAKALRQFQS